MNDIERAAEIVLACSKAWGVGYEEIANGRKTDRITEARHAAIWLIYRHIPTLSQSDIGRMFGQDHSTIHYVRSKMRKVMLGECELATLTRRVSHELYPGVRPSDDRPTFDNHERFMVGLIA